MNRNLFLNQQHNEVYNQQGFLHIPNFLSSNQLSFLKEIYRKKEKSFFDKGFHRTLDLKNLKKKTDICNHIASVVSPNSENYLNHYRMLLTSFMTKEKSADAFDIHQNWTFVEEDKFTSLVIWIPLQDVNEENGCMYFIPGSDKWEKGIRGNNITWHFAEKKQELLQQMIPLPMNAGAAVIFDDATIHYTSANKTNQPRISIAQVMIPKEAQPIFYNKNLQTQQIEKFYISDDFYLNFTNEYLNRKTDRMKMVEFISI